MYVPSLCYFDAMMFLRYQETTAPLTSIVTVQDESEEDDGANDEPTPIDTTQVNYEIIYSFLVSNRINP